MEPGMEWGVAEAAQGVGSQCRRWPFGSYPGLAGSVTVGNRRILGWRIGKQVGERFRKEERNRGKYRWRRKDHREKRGLQRNGERKAKAENSATKKETRK